MDAMFATAEFGLAHFQFICKEAGVRGYNDPYLTDKLNNFFFLQPDLFFIKLEGTKQSPSFEKHKFKELTKSCLYEMTLLIIQFVQAEITFTTLSQEKQLEIGFKPWHLIELFKLVLNASNRYGLLQLAIACERNSLPPFAFA